MKMINTLDEYNEFLESSIRTTSVEIEIKHPFSKRIEIIGEEERIKKVMIAADLDKKILYIFDGSFLKDWHCQNRREYKNYLIDYAIDRIETLESQPDRFWINPKKLDDIGVVSYSNFSLWTSMSIGIQYFI